MSNAKTGSGTRSATFPLHNYIVEFRSAGGELTRLEVEQSVDTIAVEIGREVPLLISPDGTKAVLDAKDPSINVVAVSRADDAADKERFRKRLDSDS